MNEQQLAAHMARLATEVGRQEQALYTNPVRVRRRTGSPAIDLCATGNCQKQQLGSVLGEEKPWWFWLAVGAGVGGFLYAASRSGMFRNPGDGASETSQRAAAIAVQAGIPTILWGAPGIGKTAWLESLGKAMGGGVGEDGRKDSSCKVFTVIGSTRDPADIAGMMTKQGTLIPPSWARELQARSLAGLRSVLFLDEFSSMTPLVHAALLRVVQNKIAGDCNFDPKFKKVGFKTIKGKRTPIWKPTKFRGNAVHIVCAANPRSMGAQAIDLPPPAANRMLHIDWPTPSAAEWAKGIMEGFLPPRLDSLPLDWKRSKAAREAREDIAAFLSHMTTDLLMVPETPEEKGRAWPSPRSWELAADALGAARFLGVSEGIQNKLIMGCVGFDAEDRFAQWIEQRRAWLGGIKKSLTDLFKGTKSLTEISGFDKIDHMYGIVHEYITDITNEPTLEKWNRAWEFIEKSVDVSSKAKSGQISGVSAEFSAPLIILASDLLDLLNDPVHAKGALKNAELPSEKLLESLEYDNIKVRRSR